MSVLVASMPTSQQLPHGGVMSSMADVVQPPTSRGQSGESRQQSTSGNVGGNALAVAQQQIQSTKSRSPMRQRDEPRGAYRARSIEAITEANGDVSAFIDELDQKRRQLDEQIHRYIKQKEREYKLYERDLRILYRSGRNADEIRRLESNNGESVISQDKSPVDEEVDGRTEVTDTRNARMRTNGDDNGTSRTETRTNRTRPESRHSELTGLVTPDYLRLVESKSNADQHSTSAPPTSILEEHVNRPERGIGSRANSDSITETAQAQRPARYRLEQRTSSSGSERNLVSALKSPAGIKAGYPKKKRVSLVVGDAVVAPADIPAGTEDDNKEADASTTSGGSQITEQSGARRPSLDAITHTEGGIPEAAPLLLSTHKEDGTVDIPNESQLRESVARAKKNADLESPFTMDEDIGDTAIVVDGDDEPGSEEDAHSASPSPPSETEEAKANNHHDADSKTNTDNRSASTEQKTNAKGTLAEQLSKQSDSANSGIKAKNAASERPDALSRLRISSTSSAQPTSPGFSRPSVRADPVAVFHDSFKTPEIEDNSTYGSYGPLSVTAAAAANSSGGRATSNDTQSTASSATDANGPSAIAALTKAVTPTVGSLGESYMARNAQEVSRRRRSSGSGSGKTR